MITAILSDIHGRLDSFLSVAADPEFSRADRIFFLGDLSGYGPDPEGCAELWRKLRRRISCISVAGNHELLVIGGLRKARFSRSARDSHDGTDEGLSRKTLLEFADLPVTATAGEAFLCHGSPTDPCEYLTSPSDVRTALKEIGDCRWLFTGHTHVPAFWDGHKLFRPRQESEKKRYEGVGPWFLNPGSVGQPRDGRSGASYCLWNDSAQTVTFRSVPVLTPGARRQRSIAS